MSVRDHARRWRAEDCGACGRPDAGGSHGLRRQAFAPLVPSFGVGLFGAVRLRRYSVV